MHHINYYVLKMFTYIHVVITRRSRYSETIGENWNCNITPWTVGCDYNRQLEGSRS